MEEKKETKIVDNSRYREPNEFVFSVNNNIICQRFFRVNGFNIDAIHSVELYKTFREIVNMVKNDLVSKSRRYILFAMPYQIKLRGFSNDEDLTEDDHCALSSSYEGYVQLSNGKIVEKEFLPLNNEDKSDDSKCVFKFAYKYDGRTIYEEAWDGKVYPKYIRNGVNLSNSVAPYKGSTDNMPYTAQINAEIYGGRIDLIREIIRRLCNVLSNGTNEDGEVKPRTYTKNITVGDKKYYCGTYDRAYVRGWSEATKEKTIKYRKWADWWFNPKTLNYIDKYL